jgi:hypothetical protein
LHASQAPINPTKKNKAKKPFVEKNTSHFHFLFQVLLSYKLKILGAEIQFNDKLFFSPPRRMITHIHCTKKLVFNCLKQNKKTA